MRGKRVLWVSCSLLAVGMVALMFYWFRSESIENPALGTITYHYRWGKRTSLTADTNRDGRIDVRARIDEWDTPLEYWEDSNYDGSFDRRIVMEKGEIALVELDEDGDGIFERQLEGEEARDFYMTVRIPQGSAKEWPGKDVE